MATNFKSLLPVIGTYETLNSLFYSKCRSHHASKFSYQISRKLKCMEQCFCRHQSFSGQMWWFEHGRGCRRGKGCEETGQGLSGCRILLRSKLTNLRNWSFRFGVLLEGLILVGECGTDWSWNIGGSYKEGESDVESILWASLWRET